MMTKTQNTAELAQAARLDAYVQVWTRLDRDQVNDAMAFALSRQLDTLAAEIAANDPQGHKVGQLLGTRLDRV